MKMNEYRKGIEILKWDKLDFPKNKDLDKAILESFKNSIKEFIEELDKAIGVKR